MLQCRFPKNFKTKQGLSEVLYKLPAIVSEPRIVPSIDFIFFFAKKFGRGADVQYCNQKTELVHGPTPTQTNLV